MVDVFISYSRTDRAMVSLLARAVEAEGYEVWWDADLPPHQSYGDVITAKIGAARAAIVVWSAQAVKSEWVRAEADMARNQKKLVQTALDNVMPPLPFNQIQFAEIGDWRGEPDHPGWRKVKASLADLCGREPEPPGEARRFAVPPVLASPAPPPAVASKAPLFAGIGIAVVAIAIAAGVSIGQRSGAPIGESTAAGSAPASLASVDSVPVISETPAFAAAGEVLPVPRSSATPATSSTPSPTIADSVPDAAPVPEARAQPGRQIFPQSATRLLGPVELSMLTPARARIARNEIYARHGLRFKDPFLQEYFGRMSWYQPTADEVDLSEIELANVAALRRLEIRRSAGAVR